MLRGLCVAALLMITPAAADEMKGEQITAVFNYCNNYCTKASKSPAWTIKGHAFIHGCMKICLIKNGVPADMVFVLLNG